MSSSLICPICKQPLILSNRTFRCVSNHSFDQAKQGYVNLYPSQKKNHGDDDGMILARHNFLKQGYYLPLLETIKTTLTTTDPLYMVDCGCGEGYYTQAIQQQFNNQIIAVDLSKKAVSYLKEPGIQPVIASIKDLPLENESMTLALNIFAPVYADEVWRVLKPGGHFLIVYAGENHLLGLKKELYETVRPNPPFPIDQSGFEVVSTKTLIYDMTLDQTGIHQLLSMTPYTYKTSKQDLARVKQLSTLTTNVQFELLLLKKEQD